MSGVAVVDANVCVAWLLNEPNGSLLTEALANFRVIVLPIWRSEVCNALLKSERRRQSSRDQVNIAAGIMDNLPIDEMRVAAEATAELLVDFTRPHQLSAYDATYVALAVEQSATLFTCDSNMIAAAGRLGVAVETA